MATKPSKPIAVEERELRLKYLYEHGLDLHQRIITISAGIDDATFIAFNAAVTELESVNRKEITVRLFSEGGSVYAALAIVGRMQGSSCRFVTEGYGCVMSAATLILASGDRRRMSELGWFMHHEASYEFDGKHSEARAYFQQQELEEQRWAACMAARSHMPAEYWYTRGVGTDLYLTPEQLLDCGVVDELF